MGVLVLRYETTNDQVSLTPQWQSAGQPQTGRTYASLCSFQQVQDLSSQMHSLLAEAVWVLAGSSQSTGAQAVIQRLEHLRELGEQLRRCLLPEELVPWLRSHPEGSHVLVECPVGFSAVPVEWMVLEGEFLAYRYATGKQPLSEDRPSLPSGHPQGAQSEELVPYRSFSVVDPQGLLERAGACHLRNCWEAFRQRWASGPADLGPVGPGYAPHQMIDVRDVRAFRPVRKEKLAEAFRQKEMVLLIGHYVTQPSEAGGSGFVLGEVEGQEGQIEIFTSTDLIHALQGAGSRPLLVVAIACESGEVGVGSLGGGAGFSDMVQAVVGTGIPHYVGAAVRIPADLSAGLVEPFFRGLIEARSVGEALRLARLAFRRRPSDPLDPGTALGLSFLLYGDPRIGYFCFNGHRLDRLVHHHCEATEENGRLCGRMVCSQEHTEFARFRCALHTGVKLRCSAGHELADQSQVQQCRKCGNLVCPQCRGYAQQLCWVHLCYEGHEIPPQDWKTCPDPFGLHPEEKRSVCPECGGWLRGLCPDCLRKSHEGLESCSHCGHFIDETKNPWSEVRCSTCGRLYCEHCKSWYLATGYCRDPRQPDRDSRWLASLEDRSREDGQLASAARLAECGKLGKKFQDLMAAHLEHEVAWYDPLPRLKTRWWSVWLPEPRCWRGVRLDGADLTAELAEALKSQWRLSALAPPWEPPSTWQSLYGRHQNQSQTTEPPANQVRVHMVRGLLGKRVLVAVATLSPVELQPGRGPVLVPTGSAHLACLEQVIRQWWQLQGGGVSAPDLYLVVLSTTGWEGQTGQPGCPEDYALPGPDRLTVAAEPQGRDDFRVAFPPVVGQPTRIRNFLALLSPQTHSQRLTKICQWLEDTLKVRSFISIADAQEELETLWHCSIHPQWIRDGFAHLARTGQYQITWKENPELRKASPLEQVQHLMARHWWQSWLFWVITVVAFLFSLVSILLGDLKNTQIGLIVVLGAQILNFLSKLLAVWNEKTNSSVPLFWKQ